MGFLFIYLCYPFILQQGVGFEKFVLFVLNLAAAIKDLCPPPQKFKVGFVIILRLHVDKRENGCFIIDRVHIRSIM